MAFQQIVPLLYVSDMQCSRTFYIEGLGFKETEEWSPENQLKWCRLERDGAAIMLQLIEESHEYQFDKTHVGAGVVFFFNCDNVDRIQKEFIERCVEVPEVEVAFYGMKQLELTDPDGYQLCFQSPVVGK